jgi:alkaline phosphatase D
VKFSTIPGRRYDPNPDGDILGEVQWDWLERELTKSDAAIHIIASSIQFVSNEHWFEKWGNFPKSRQRMLDLLAKVKPANTFFISGDRHIGEVSKMNVDGLPYSLYDFTSSGLTHTWDEPRDEPNGYRVGRLIVQKNFGLITINWNDKLPDLVVEIRGKDGVVWQSTPVRF